MVMARIMRVADAIVWCWLVKGDVLIEFPINGTVLPLSEGFPPKTCHNYSQELLPGYHKSQNSLTLNILSSQLMVLSPLSERFPPKLVLISNKKLQVLKISQVTNMIKHRKYIWGPNHKMKCDAKVTKQWGQLPEIFLSNLVTLCVIRGGQNPHQNKKIGIS